MRRSIAGLFAGVWLLAGCPLALLAQTTIAPTGGGTTTIGGGGTTFNGGGGGGATIGGDAAIGSGTSIGTTGPPKGPRSGAGSATSIPSNSNVFANTYIDYLALGKPSLYANTTAATPPKITTSTFGQPIYGNTATAKTAGPAGGTGTTTAIGFTTVGQPRNPSYITALSSEIPFVRHETPALLASARSVIDQSSYINNKHLISVSVQEGVVFLRGQVGTEKERRIAESTLRLTPGVRDVQNYLAVNPTALPTARR